MRVLKSIVSDITWLKGYMGLKSLKRLPIFASCAVQFAALAFPGDVCLPRTDWTSGSLAGEITSFGGPTLRQLSDGGFLLAVGIQSNGDFSDTNTYWGSVDVLIAR